MKELPSSETYEKEFRYMPWGVLIQTILDVIEENMLEKSKVLDLMCGPGFLLNKLREIRPDLKLKGIDIDKGYIKHAKAKYAEIQFEVADVLKWETDEKFDLIICTGGMHHITFENQEEFIKKLRSLLNKKDSLCILADPYIDDYSNEKERRIGAAKLGYEYLLEIIENDAPQEIISAAIDILHNDVMGFEFKNSIKKIKPILEKYFSFIEVHKTWPKSDSQYGEYFFILKS